MDRLKKIVIPFILVFTMISQTLMAYEIPNEIKGKEWKEINVKYEGMTTSTVVPFVSKTVNGKTISGYASLDVKAYAYKTADNIKIGATITYMTPEGEMKTDWWDQVQQFSNLSEAEKILGWPACSDYYITVANNIEFVSKTQNENELNLLLQMQGKSATSAFTRQTEKGVKLTETVTSQYPSVQMQAMNKKNVVINSYSVTFDGKANIQEQIFPKPLILGTGGKMGVTVKGNQIAKTEYQFIENEAKPDVQSNAFASWIDLGGVTQQIVNTKDAYPDLIDKEGQISTRHYIYNFSKEQYPSGTTPPRGMTFGTPIGESLVIQKAAKDIGDRYYSTEGGNAFFGKSKIADTGGANKAVKFWGYIIPDVTGEYNLGAFADDGAYGYIIIGNEKKVFVEDWRITVAQNRTGILNSADYTKATNETERNNIINNAQKATPILTLEKNKVYPIYMEWYEGNPVEKAFIPRYTEAGRNNWTDIPSNWFYASKDKTPGEIGTAYFDAYTADKVIDFPSKEGTYYAALKITGSKGTPVRYVLNGPFSIKEIKPLVSKEGEAKNFIAPETLSNVACEITFKEYSKDVKYELDLAELTDNTKETNRLVDFGAITNAKVVITKEDGSELVKDTDYKISYPAGKFAISIQLDNPVTAGSKQFLNIYLPTKMRTGINYQSDYAKHIGSATVSILVTAIATPRIQESYTVDGKTEPEKYSSEPEQENKNITLKYMAMPRIY